MRKITVVESVSLDGVLQAPRPARRGHVLLIHPVVLGSGRRLFADDGERAALRLVSSVPTSTGATYRTEATR